MLIQLAYRWEYRSLIYNVTDLAACGKDPGVRSNWNFFVLYTLLQFGICPFFRKQISVTCPFLIRIQVNIDAIHHVHLVLELPFIKYYETIFSSALCYCTAELLSSRGRPSSSVRPSVDIVFSEITEWINAKFWGQVPTHHISRPFFLFFKILNFWFFTICFRFR